MRENHSLDQFGRRINYLRVSVTDRCNFRCIYCMPLSGMQWLQNKDILSYEEIRDIVTQLSALGLKRIRITGGEPTIRPHLTKLIRMLKEVRGIEDISLSTNGITLHNMAKELKDAGLDRVNISADSLRPERVAAISRRELGFSLVKAAIAAEEAGLDPIKVNMVVMRGINDDEIVEFAKLTMAHRWHIRFIELMPVGELRALTWQHVVEGREVLERISALGAVESTTAPLRSNGPAKYYKLAGSVGSLGIITPLSHSYCADCNRVRLTADGRLRTCLFGDHEVPLREALRRGESLTPLFTKALAEKPREHALLTMRNGGLRALSQVGG